MKKQLLISGVVALTSMLAAAEKEKPPSVPYTNTWETKLVTFPYSAFTKPSAVETLDDNILRIESDSPILMKLWNDCVYCSRVESGETHSFLVRSVKIQKGKITLSERGGDPIVAGTLERAHAPIIPLRAGQLLVNSTTNIIYTQNSDAHIATIPKRVARMIGELHADSPIMAKNFMKAVFQLGRRERVADDYSVANIALSITPQQLLPSEFALPEAIKIYDTRVYRLPSEDALAIVPLLSEEEEIVGAIARDAKGLYVITGDAPEGGFLAERIEGRSGKVAYPSIKLDPEHFSFCLKLSECRTAPFIFTDANNQMMSCILVTFGNKELQFTLFNPEDLIDISTAAYENNNFIKQLYYLLNKYDRLTPH